MTRNFRNAWVLALGVLSACELPSDLLEVGNADDGDSSGDGDTASETGDGDTTETGDTGDTEPDEIECIEQGSNLNGDNEPESGFRLPLDCEKNICAEGWGHHVPWLESEWTRPTQAWADPIARGALAITPDDGIAVVLSGPEHNYYLTTLSPEGTDPFLLIAEDPLSGDVIDFGIDGDTAIYYFLWRDGVTQHLIATNGDDQTFFDLELGPSHQHNSRLEVIDDGLLIALDDGDTRLMRFTEAGDLVFQKSIPATTRIDISPSGNVIALANNTTISWADTQGNFLGDQAIDDVESLLGLVAVDDTHVVIAGGEPDPVVGTRAFLREFGAMGAGWSHSYDRAEKWCVEWDPYPTEELFTDVVQLADGTLVVAGIESMGYPHSSNFDYSSQPWVAHVSAAGEVLEFDRGLWDGRIRDVVARDNVVYVFLTKFGSIDNFGVPYIRKYSF